MKLLLFFWVGIVEACLGGPAVDDLFKDYDRPNVPGASVAVIQKGKIVLERGYGLANLDTKEPATAFTNYRLASLSKQFTAMAMMILIEEGKATLDQTITDILPQFPSYGREIKIRHLLGHLGGLKDYEDLIPSSVSNQLSDYDVLDIYQNQSSGISTAGSSYHYSNGGYVMLGVLVEKLSGQNYGSFLRNRIFERLGMYHSVLMQKGVTIPNRAYGYSSSGSGFSKTDQSSTSATRGDGCVYTSVHDWLKWELALQNHRLVSPAMQKLAFTPGILNNGNKTDYGFGWMLGTYQGLPHTYHTGSTIGFRTAVNRIADRDLTVVVLINRAESEPWTIARKILDRYLVAN